MTDNRHYHAYTARHLDDLLKKAGMAEAEREQVAAVAAVLPFRVNDYVVRDLIDWAAVPSDPIYRLTFPQADMLPAADRSRVVELLRRGASQAEVNAVVRGIRAGLQPHPGGQQTLNAAVRHDEVLPGLQHKYAETVLVFPQQGQTCHAYCTYCFRWPQFVGQPELRLATNSPESVRDYVADHPEVTSVLLTGGDPLIMSTATLRRYVEPLLDPALDHLESIRIGTKALAYWPYRVTTDRDAADLLHLIEEIGRSGRHAAVMAHYSHPRELETTAARQAVSALTSAGAVIRCQAPLIRTVNDDAAVWAQMWRLQVRLGAIPYYLFIERDTGPCEYFAVPLALAVEIFADAYRQVSGLARTVRGR